MPIYKNFLKFIAQSRFASNIKYITSNLLLSKYVNLIGNDLYSAMFPSDRATCFPPPPRLRPNCNAAESGVRALRRWRPCLRPPAAF